MNFKKEEGNTKPETETTLEFFVFLLALTMVMVTTMAGQQQIKHYSLTHYNARKGKGEKAFKAHEKWHARNQINGSYSKKLKVFFSILFAVQTIEKRFLLFFLTGVSAHLHHRHVRPEKKTTTTTHMTNKTHSDGNNKVRHVAMCNMWCVHS